jgi:hypothetical protein
MNRPTARLWIVAAVSLALLLLLALVEWNVYHAGTFGVSFDTRGTLLAVDSGSPAALAGIARDDRIDLRSLKTPDERRVLLEPRVGESVRATIVHAGVPRAVTLVAVPIASPLRLAITAIGFLLLVLISVGLATLLLLLRPQPATWAFYAYALLMTIKSFEGNLLVGSAAAAAVVSVVFQLSWSAAIVALLFFATRIFAWSHAWRRYVEAAAIVAGIANALSWAYPVFAVLFAWNGGWAPLGLACGTVFLSIVLGTLAAIAISSRREGRQRALWIIAGISLVPLIEWCDVIALLAFSLHPQPSLEAVASAVNSVDFALLPWLPIATALAVYYALIHERIVDIRLALGRAATYALTTAVVIVVFAILEWGFGQLFEGSQAAGYASLIAVVIVAFSFNAVRDRADRTIELLFFSKEREAEERLRRISRALLYANSERLVIEFLLEQPVEALELASGAIFTRDENGAGFRRIAAKHWENAALVEIPADDALVAQLQAVQQPLDLRAAGWDREGLPTGESAPSLAVQVTMRGEAFALALYGRHIGGAEIADDARELLQSIAANAAAAFDHLDAERSRREIAALRAENTALRARSDAGLRLGR